MSLALLKLASPKNLLKLATAYEETEELTERALAFKERVALDPAEWEINDLLTAKALIYDTVATGSAWKSALKPVVKLLLKYLRKAKEKA